MDTYADDLITLGEPLNHADSALVGHSYRRWWGGVLHRSRHEARIEGAAISDVAPLILKITANPEGLPTDAFDKIRGGFRADRSQFFKDLSGSFYGANSRASSVSDGLRESFWLQGMQREYEHDYDCIKALYRLTLKIL